MIYLATIAALLLVCLALRTNVVEVPVAGAGETIKLLEVVLRARSLISMSRTNRASLWSIIKLRLPVEEDSREAEVTPEAALVATINGEISGEGLVVVSILGVAELPINAAAGGAGGTGRRYGFIQDDFNLVLIFIAQNNRTRESSVAISPSWSMLEEIEFHRLAKLRLEVDEPEELYGLHQPLHLNVR